MASGKSVIFQSFLLIVDAASIMSCALVISPVNSLIQDRVRFLTSIGVNAAYIGEEQNDKIVTRKKGVDEGGLFQVLLGSLESFLGCKFCNGWGSILTSATYRERLRLSAIDEAHCIQHWGFSTKKGEQAFRKWFSRISEIWSLVKGVPFVVLTATATKKTQEKIVKALEMEEAVILHQIPNQKNIVYSVQAVSSGANNTIIIHYGPSRNIEAYHQKSGRA